MFFTVDTQTQQIKAHKSMGEAAKHAVSLLGCEAVPGTDPVKMFRQLNTADRLVILNLSDAFESISESDDQAAQELAASFKQAIDAYYGR